MYNVRLYFNTGYDLVNIPYCGQMLDAASYVDTVAVDLLQRKFISTLKIKKNYGNAMGVLHTNLEEVDYVRIEGEQEFTGGGATAGRYVYYSVLSVKMTSADVAELTIAEDFFTTAGGVPAIKLSAGIVTRLSKKTNSFTGTQIPDELLNCAYPLMLVCESLDYQSPAYNQDFTFVESTVDLALGATVETIHDASQGQPQDIKIPTMAPVDSETQYQVPYAGKIGNPNGTKIYRLTDSGAVPGADIAKSIAQARTIKMEDAIISQYKVPFRFVEIPTGTNVMNLLKGKALESTPQGRFLKKIDFLSGEGNVTYPAGRFHAGGTLNTNNVYLSLFSNKNCRFGMITASGERAEYGPLELCYTRRRNAEYNTSSEFTNDIIVERIADPSPNGRPYYRFKNIHGMDLFNSVNPQSNPNSTDLTQGMLFFLAGANWERVALKFTQVSGLDILQEKFKNSMISSNTGYEGQFRGADYQKRIAGIEKAMTDYYNPTSENLDLGDGRFANAIEGFTQGNMLGEGLAAITGIVRRGNLGSAMGGGSSLVAAGADKKAEGFSTLGTAANVAAAGVSLASTGLSMGAEAAKASELANLAYNYAGDNIQVLRAAMSAKRIEELYAYGVSAYTVAPQITLPGDYDLKRTAMANGVLIYRYLPDPEDIKRLTGIIKMFGEARFDDVINGPSDEISAWNGTLYKIIQRRNYRVETPGNYPAGQRLSQHGNTFCYIKIEGATVSEIGNFANDGSDSSYYSHPTFLSKTEREGLAAQLQNGVRIWINATPKNPGEDPEATALNLFTP